MTPAQIVAEFFYTLIGLVFALVGVKALRDPGAQKKETTAAFWFVLAFTFILGNYLPKWITGLCVIALAVLTAINGVRQSANDVPDPKAVRASADKLGYKVFIPALCLALVAVVAATLGGSVPSLNWLTANNAIGVSGVIALIVALVLFKANPAYIVKDGTRLKQLVSDTEYDREIRALITTPYLYVDDLLKQEISAGDIRLVYEIVNGRYIAGRPTILSSERSLETIRAACAGK